MIRPVSGDVWVRYGDQILLALNEREDVRFEMAVDLDGDGVSGLVLQRDRGGVYAWEVQGGRAVLSDRRPVGGLEPDQRPGFVHAGADWYVWRGRGLTRVDPPLDPATAPSE